VEADQGSSLSKMIKSGSKMTLLRGGSRASASAMDGESSMNPAGTVEYFLLLSTLFRLVVVENRDVNLVNL